MDHNPITRHTAVACCLPVQFDPELIKSAEVAISEVIKELPQKLVDEAQQFRVDRAAGKA
jgi:hypothetical protein